MKNLNLNSGIRFSAIKFIVIALFAGAFVACDKDDETMRDEASFVVEADDLKKGKAAAPKSTFSIAETAIGAGFGELVNALSYVDEELDAGLVDLFLNGTDQYTVFAPTDIAFNNLYSALKIDGITDLEPELVLEVLLYHVTTGRRAANSVVPPVRPRQIDTLLGKSFTVDKKGKITAIGNSANIETPNVSASNGIIHVIDAVILPF